MGTKLDDLYVDLSLRNHQAVIGGLAGIKNAIAAVKATTAGGLAIKGGGMFAASNLAEIKSFFGAAGITGLIGVGTVKLAADLEQARLGLKRFVDSDFSGLSAGIDKMSYRIPIAVTGLYDIASGAAQVGVEGTANILAFTEVVGKLATVSDMSFNETAKDLAKLHNVFNLKPGEAPRTANVIAGLAAASAADPGELITTTRMLSGATSTIKFTLDQTIALAAAIKDAGISSEVGATAFNKLILDMGKSPAEFARITDMTTGEFKKLRDDNPVQALLKALKSIESESNIDDKIAKSEAIGVESVRQSGAVLQMIKALENLTQHLDRAQKFGDEKTVLDKQFNTQAESAWNVMKRFGNTWMQMADKLGGGVMGFLKAYTNGMIDLGQRVIGERPVVNWKGQQPFPGIDQAVPFDPKKMEMKRARDAIEKEIRIADENLGVHNEGINARRATIKQLEGEANAIGGSKKMAEGDLATRQQHRAIVMKLVEQDKLLATAMDARKPLEASVAAAKAKFVDMMKSPEQQKAAAEQGFLVKQGARKFAFDQMIDPQGFAQFQTAFRGLPKELANSGAGQELAKKLAAMGGADIKKNMTEDELMQLVAKRQGAIAAVAGAVAQERVQRLYARPTFTSGEETWKRIAAGAAEGSPMERILKENSRLQKENTIATKAVEDEIKGLRAEIKNNVVVLTGEP